MAARKKRTKKVVVRKIGATRGCGKVVGLMGEAGGPTKPREGMLTYVTRNGAIVMTPRRKGWGPKKTCSVSERAVHRKGKKGARKAGKRGAKRGAKRSARRGGARKRDANGHFVAG